MTIHNEQAASAARVRPTRRDVIKAAGGAIGAAALLSFDCTTALGDAVQSRPLQCFHKVDLGELPPGFITLGDLDSDGRVDFLVSILGDRSTHRRLSAVDFDGRTLWDVGAGDARAHNARGEPPCRGYCLVYDVDHDGRNEVVVEMTHRGSSMIRLLDGATGKEKKSIAWPLGAKGGRSRPSPGIYVAHLDGRDQPPSLILKYEASNTCPTVVVALDRNLEVRWKRNFRPTGIGHHATIFDLDGDGRDEVVLGEIALDHSGSIVFEREFGIHSDMTDVFVDREGLPRVLVSICQEGPAYCLSGKGELLWQQTQEEVSHGQAIWAGNFLPDRPGQEVIILKSGHYGIFGTYDAETGKKLADFEHRSGIRHRNGQRRYPDMPVRTLWSPQQNQHALWIPVDRTLVDGKGRVLADLGEQDADVVQHLKPGDSKSQLAVQAIAACVYDDQRDDLVLYQPYHGKAVYIFGADDKAGQLKAYAHAAPVYNRKSYF